MSLDLSHVRKNAATVRRAVEDCKAIAKARARRQWFALRWQITDCDVLADFLSAGTRDAFYWQEPSRELALLGLGRLLAIAATGRERFCETAAQSRALFDNLQVHDLPAMDASLAKIAKADQRGPLLLGGFAFFDTEVGRESEWYGLGAGRLVLPEVTIVARKAGTWVTRTCAVEAESRVDEIMHRLSSELSPAPDRSHPVFSRGRGLPSKPEIPGPEICVQADRAHGQYMAQVEAAVTAIAAGKFKKVVLARSLRVTGDHDFDLTSFLSSLRTLFPSCATLAVREGEDLFVSATPERLVALEGDEVRTTAVAGSAARGRYPEEEAQYSAALCESEKERAEHALVQTAIRAALRESCGSLEGPSVPRLLKLEGIQHLETPLRGRLLPHRRGITSVLDLVQKLHPTPAVAGAPRETALDWLEHFEALDRGWYAGPVGYVDGRGNGEFRVALRSALLRGRSARLFAGAGIVAGSEPAHELAETRLKLRALLAPLTEI